MKGKIKFNRKDPVMEVYDFDVIAAVTLSHEQFERFQKNMLNDYDFIVPFSDEMHVDSNDIAHSMLALDEEGEDGDAGSAVEKAGKKLKKDYAE